MTQKKPNVFDSIIDRLRNFFAFGSKKDIEESVIFQKKIRQLKSAHIRQMLINASLQLEEHQAYIDRINVFPVADGDTGSNIVHTFKSIRHELEQYDSIPLSDLVLLVSKMAMINARGNIGIITSQYLKGFLESFSSIKIIDAELLVEALREGARVAYDSLDHPKRGTVLDVFDGAARGAESALQKTDNTAAILDFALQEAREALEKTRSILPQMQKAQVVDAGGAAFLLILGGFVASIKKGEVVIAEDINPQGMAIIEEEDLSFRFCTECVIKESSITIAELKKKIESLGNSMHVLSAGKTMKVHIHTNQPDSVKILCEKFGTIADWKVDDMQVMQKENLERFARINRSNVGERIAIVTDSSADIPKTWFKKYSIFVADMPIYLSQAQDDLSLQYGTEEFYERMQLDPEFLPKTSQPSPQSFITQFERAFEVADRVFCLPLSQELSGTYKSALLAKERMPGKLIHLIDTRSTSAGLALMVQYIFKQKEKGSDLLDITTGLYELRDRIQIYFVVSNFAYLERSGRLSKSKSLFGRLLHLAPLLSLQNGAIEPTDEKIIFSAPEKKIELLSEKIQAYLQNNSLQYLYIVHTGAEEQARRLMFTVEEQLGIADDLVDLFPLSKVLGSHLGPGALGIIFV